MIQQDPVIPLWWGKNQKGMQAREELPAYMKEQAKHKWLVARDDAIAYARSLESLGLHKQIVNRVIEPWMFITVILSATEFENFFHLRCHQDAQPEIAWVAREMRYHLQHNEPDTLDVGEWHLPLVSPEEMLEWPMDMLKKISVGRCARVSYLTHAGQRDPQADIDLHDRLLSPGPDEPGHWSPFEHVAIALDTPVPSGNFIGWQQYRKTFVDEYYGSK